MLLIASSVAAQSQYDKGSAAYKRGDYDTALAVFRPLAESGDWNAQGFLAHTYKLMEDYREAYAWYHASAKCGSKDAQIELSMLAPKLSDKIIEQGTAIGNIYYDRYCR